MLSRRLTLALCALPLCAQAPVAFNRRYSELSGADEFYDLENDPNEMTNTRCDAQAAAGTRNAVTTTRAVLPTLPRIVSAAADRQISGNSNLICSYQSFVRLRSGPVAHDAGIHPFSVWAFHLVTALTTAGGLCAQSSFPTHLDGVFDNIRVHGAAVRVEFGSASRAVLTDGGPDRARMSIRSGTLHVACSTPCGANSPEIVRVTAPRVSSFEINDGGRIEVGRGFPAASALAVLIRGGGAIDAASLRAHSVTAVISGGGVATVSATRNLTSQISGGGTVKYFGDPQLLTSPEGGGAVQRLGAAPPLPAASVFTDARDGRVYRAVTVGAQVWMSENLAFLPRVCETEDTGCGIWVYGVSGNDIPAARKSPAYQNSGALYNWAEAARACPAGWHLPSDAEWQTLERELGMSAADAASSVWRGSTEGTAVKMGGSSGLGVVLGGWRTSFGKFNFAGQHANFWTATEADDQSAIERLVGAGKTQIGRHTGLKGCGFSVRCVRD